MLVFFSMNSPKDLLVVFCVNKQYNVLISFPSSFVYMDKCIKVPKTI